MGTFLTQNWPSILLALITTGLLAGFRWTWQQLKIYKKLLNEKENEITESMIEKAVEPIYEELEKLRQQAKQVEHNNEHKLGLIVDSFRFQLVGLCKTYLRRGTLSTEEFDDLSDFYADYVELGGNGKAKECYEKVKRLPISDR